MGNRSRVCRPSWYRALLGVARTGCLLVLLPRIHARVLLVIFLSWLIDKHYVRPSTQPGLDVTNRNRRTKASSSRESSHRGNVECLDARGA